MTDDVSEQHAKEFFETYGRAMLAWQYVEDSLFLIFSTLVRGRDHHIVSAVYHAIVNLNSKLDMITEAMQVAFPETPLFLEWEKLEKAIRSHARNRNILAHFTLLGSIPKEAEDAVTLRLARSMYDARHKAHLEPDIKQIAAWDASFGNLGDKVDAFRRKLADTQSGV
jgi:hypothetical protein